ncbi:MAG: hypothetical protein KC416_07935 [Myxococcales bacterium]|nr:hypothetical protein [Myxococcales bacterium]
MPSTIVVREGQTLTIENTDPFSHKLYSSEVEGFTPLQTAPGNSRSVKFPKAGVFSIRDASHAFVRGTVHVLPDVSAHAEVSSSGRFRFADVPNGSYTLKVFFRDRLVASQPVQVDGPREANLGTVDAPAAKLSSTGN